jgi:hypothetical protein
MVIEIETIVTKNKRSKKNKKEIKETKGITAID